MNAKRYPTLLQRGLPPIRVLSALVAAAFCLLLAGAPRAAAQVTLQCEVLDAVSNQAITTTTAGSEVIVMATVIVPPASQGARIDVAASVKLKLGNVSLPYNIPITPVSSPNVDPKTGAVLVQSGVERRRFKIPLQTPVGTSLKLTVSATVLGQTSNRCVATLTIR